MKELSGSPLWVAHDYIYDEYKLQPFKKQNNASSKHPSFYIHIFQKTSLPLFQMGFPPIIGEKKKVSVFTCVVTTRRTARSYAAISDAMPHDRAPLSFALSKIHKCLEILPQSHVTCVSDSAASRYKKEMSRV